MTFTVIVVVLLLVVLVNALIRLAKEDKPNYQIKFKVPGPTIYSDLDLCFYNLNMAIQAAQAINTDDLQVHTPYGAHIVDLKTGKIVWTDSRSF